MNDHRESEGAGRSIRERRIRYSQDVRTPVEVIRRVVLKEDLNVNDDAEFVFYDWDGFAYKEAILGGRIYNPLGVVATAGTKLLAQLKRDSGRWEPLPLPKSELGAVYGPLVEHDDAVKIRVAAGFTSIDPNDGGYYSSTPEFATIYGEGLGLPENLWRPDYRSQPGDPTYTTDPEVLLPETWFFAVRGTGSARHNHPIYFLLTSDFRPTPAVAKLIDPMAQGGSSRATTLFPVPSSGTHPTFPGETPHNGFNSPADGNITVQNLPKVGGGAVWSLPANTIVQVQFTQLPLGYALPKWGWIITERLE